MLLLLLDLHLNDRCRRRGRRDALLHVQGLLFQLLGMLDELLPIAIRDTHGQPARLTRQVS
jgi:hypothetical protein